MRKPKNPKNGPLPIYLKITVDGAAKELSTKRKCEPSQWNPKAGRAIGTRESTKELNRFLEVMEQSVYRAKRKLIDNDRELTVELLKDSLTGADEKKIMILDVFRNHNVQLKALEGIDFASNTIDRYNTTITHVSTFLKWKYDVEDIEIKKLDHEFISGFCFWFKSVQKCNHNSTMKYLSNFKKIVLICVKNKWLLSDPFSNFKFTTKVVERTALIESDLTNLTIKFFTNERLSNVRDIFLFSCYTGLSYADVQKLKKTDLNKGIDDSMWIYTNRQKTGVPSRIPLLNEAIEIIDKYIEHPKCQNSGLLLPVLSNQKMNSYLKKIADVCNIDKTLTFHIARYTFATTVTLNYGVPIETVSKMLGHTNIKQTQHYAKLNDKRVSDDMLMLKSKRLCAIKLLCLFELRFQFCKFLL
ncbi:site-specific integrase [Mucilaginibacter sp. UYNi724]